MVEPTEILERSDQAAGLERRQRTFARMAWHHLRSKPLGSIGLIVVLIVAIFAIFADVIAPFDYQAQKYDAVRVAPGVPHLFGTDEFRARTCSAGWSMERGCRYWSDLPRCCSAPGLGHCWG